MKHRYFTISIAMAMVSSLLGAACGYSLQSSHSPLSVKEGIRKIYVNPLVNNTYKAGVENVVYNNLIRTLFAHRRVILVQNKNDADAILDGTVQAAAYGQSAGASVAGLLPMVNGQGLAAALGLPTKDYVVSTEYMATLNCSFTLTRRVVKPGKKGVIWSAGFSRNEPFPAANQLDVPGTTSALINDSEFDRALADLAHKMMDDVHESMLAMF